MTKLKHGSLFSGLGGGGGSIRIACHEYGFDFTGAEINPIIWEKQERRFQPYLKKLKFDFHD